MHNAPRAYSKYPPGACLECIMLQDYTNKYVAMCFQNMLLEHVGLRILLQIIHTPGACSWSTAPGPGAYLWAKISQKCADTSVQ